MRDVSEENTVPNWNLKKRGFYWAGVGVGRKNHYYANVK
jgi:hypothetical protein